MKDSDNVFGDDARFIVGNRAGDQMAMSTAGHYAMSVNDTREWGHTVSQRPQKQGEQLTLPGMPKPSDPIVHAARQANPHLNDYQFGGAIHPEHGGGYISAYDEHGDRAAHLGWAGKQGQDPHEHLPHDEHLPHEVVWVATQQGHRNKGLAEGLWDMAHARGATPVHSIDRSEHGEAFANRVGGKKYTRTRGIGVQEYQT